MCQGAASGPLLLILVAQSMHGAGGRSWCSAAQLGAGQPPPCAPSPQCSSCSMNSPLSIRIELFGKPLILLENNKATVELSVMIQVFIKRLDGSILNLLLLKAVSGM